MQKLSSTACLHSSSSHSVLALGSLLFSGGRLQHGFTAARRLLVVARIPFVVEVVFNKILQQLLVVGGGFPYKSFPCKSVQWQPCAYGKGLRGHVHTLGVACSFMLLGQPCLGTWLYHRPHQGHSFSKRGVAVCGLRCNKFAAGFRVARVYHILQSFSFAFFLIVWRTHCMVSPCLLNV